ncbi:diaminopimelate epimerase [Sporosalibacterium faouarense]|uniref:diaminopimelate epimerase n=1 Tax=Sporosalibacterium faouarense TaxID=516123 RepID=UPI001FAF65A0|nr:diaminopimelate epimerase [Sporosalibacterium faouarense]
MIYFEKLQGAGNDFIIFNGNKEELPSLSKLAKEVCDRHFGIGADGMIVVAQSKIADVKMIFYNADGSIAPMCGNGIRCFGKYVYDKGIVDKENFDVETLAGIIKIDILKGNKEDSIDRIKVNMGKASFDTSKFPIKTDKEQFIEEDININNKMFKITALLMGTIHTVVFVDDLEEIDISELGFYIENLPIFPEKTNVNFCEIIDDHNLKVITWERGVGQTLACGTGSTAVAITSQKINRTSDRVNIHVLGGSLEIENTNDGVYMTGPAELICTGYYNESIEE